MDSLAETRRLKRNVEWALRRALDPTTVLPMLHRLSRLAAQGSDENLYAQRRLAELLVDHHPWRAALAAKRVLAALPSDDGAWAILALCHALLGHYRCAVAAYRRALAIAPDNAAYAHNLGHLLDVALDRPGEALSWLRTAYTLTGQRADVAVSLAHALARSGDLALARRVSRRALRAKDSPHLAEHVALARWLEAGASSGGRLLASRPPARAVQSPWNTATEHTETPPTRVSRRGVAATVETTLAKGLASLPLDREQRARAKSLLDDPAVQTMASAHGVALASLAAAIAYAVVFVDGVSLTQAEVAACFRVSVPALRGQWKALRAQKDLSPSRQAAERPR